MPDGKPTKNGSTEYLSKKHDEHDYNTAVAQAEEQRHIDWGGSIKILLISDRLEGCCEG